jgi:hypothetical protein
MYLSALALFRQLLRLTQTRGFLLLLRRPGWWGGILVSDSAVHDSFNSRFKSLTACNVQGGLPLAAIFRPFCDREGSPQVSTVDFQARSSSYVLKVCSHIDVKLEPNVFTWEPGKVSMVIIWAHKVRAIFINKSSCNFRAFVPKIRVTCLI